jgi:hypothetical protein
VNAPAQHLASFFNFLQLRPLNYGLTLALISNFLNINVQDCRAAVGVAASRVTARHSCRFPKTISSQAPTSWLAVCVGFQTDLLKMTFLVHWTLFFVTRRAILGANPVP